MVALAETPSLAAVTVAVPGATPVASPPLLTVATDGLDELQLTCVVISCLPPSEYVPVAVNCWVEPTNMPGVVVIEDKVAEVTVSVVFPEILPKLVAVAVMMALPAATAVAKPLLPLMLPIEALDEFQVTDTVISWLVPSEKVPMAINCWEAPTGMLRLAGVTAMENKVADVTVSVMLTEIPSEVAVMIAVPAVPAAVVTRPLLSTIATDAFELHTICVGGISWSVPSENVPMTLSCRATPPGMLGLAGVTAMEERVADVTVRM